MKTITYITLFLLISVKTNAQYSDMIDTNFINRITEDNGIHCRDCPDYDYWLIIHIKYGEIEKDVIVSNKGFVSFCGQYFKMLSLTAKEFTRDAIINNKAIIIPNKKSKKIKKKDKDLYNYFCDIPPPDSIMLSLSSDKEAFLNYYFDENHEYKRNSRFQTNDDDINYIHKVTSEVSAVIAQLFKWNIPVYWCSECENLRYGYYEKMKKKK